MEWLLSPNGYIPQVTPETKLSLPYHVISDKYGDLEIMGQYRTETHKRYSLQYLQVGTKVNNLLPFNKL